jgi:predicted metal-dependent hydrolase
MRRGHGPKLVWPWPQIVAPQPCCQLISDAAPRANKFCLLTLLNTAYPLYVGKKSARLLVLLDQFKGQHLDPRYLAYFQCFNQQLFFDAHDVLEDLWLAERNGPNYSFYKGLIQLAGAFVHLQKQRSAPAASLFRLARKYLSGYPAIYEQLDLTATIQLIDDWLLKLESHKTDLLDHASPRLVLLSR